MAAPQALGQSIANFARDGVFPGDEEISKSYVEGEALALALQAVTAARSALEVSGGARRARWRGRSYYGNNC